MQDLSLILFKKIKINVFFCEIERSVLGVRSLKYPRFFFLFLRNLADCLIFLREETAN